MRERTKRIIFLSGAAGILALAFAAMYAHAAPAAAVAPSYPMQVNAQDQQSLRQICALAQKESSLTLEQATSIGQYCLGLIQRIGLALSTPKPSESTIGAPNKASEPRTQSATPPKGAPK